MNMPKATRTGAQVQDNWKFLHIGVVIHNLDQAVEYYQGLGFETFGPEKISGSKSRIRFVQKGSLRVELIQPGKQSQSSKFLESQGEGATHICFLVDDIDKEVANLAKKGVAVLSRHVSHPGGEPIVYLDTRMVGNLMTELKQKSLSNTRES
jgi:methylmalonyl-CoA epimerase